MTLSVTGSTSALAALQTLQTSAAGSAVAPSSQTAASEASPSVSTSTSVQGLFGLVDGMGQAISAADAAGAAGQSVLSLLQSMRDSAGQAADPTLSDSDRSALDQDFQSQAGGVGAALAGAGVNGLNLVDGSTSTPVKVSLGDGASATLSPQDLTLGGPTVGLSGTASIATATAAASAFDTLGGAIGAVSGALSTLQGQGERISAHSGFVLALGQALATPGDDAGDSARLMALQVGQQLSATSGAIANQSPQSVLSLFRS